MDLRTVVAGTSRSRVTILSDETVVNDGGQDLNFRVESDDNANMLYVDGTNNRVGVGTSPVTVMDVYSTSADADGILRVYQNTATSNPTMQVRQRGEGGSLGTTQGLLIDMAGHNSGLGYAIKATTTNSNLNGGVAFNTFTLQNGGAFAFHGGGTINTSNGDNNFQVKSVNQDNMLFVDAGNDQVSVNGNQNVANAVTGDNVGPKFVVEHSTATSIGILRNDTSVVSGNSIGSLGFYGTDTTSNTPRALAAVQAVAAGTHGAGDNPTELRFYTTPDGSETLTERVTINQGGELQLATDSAFKTDSTATSATTQTAVYSFSATDYTGAKFLVCVTDSTATERYITELLVTHDGTTAVATEYGQVATDTALATFDVDISGGNVRLLATPASSNSMTFKVMSTQLLA